MKARVFTGGAMTALGLGLLIAVLAFIDGPLLYLSPLAYPIDAIRMNGLLIGASSLLIGLIVLGSSWLGKASAR